MNQTTTDSVKLTNSIGLFGYGPHGSGLERSIFLVSVGSATLLRIQGKDIIITSKPLTHSIPKEYKPKFFFKLLDKAENIKKIVIGASRNSFKAHFDDNKDISHGLSYVVLENNLSNFELLELSLNPQFIPIFDAEEIDTITIDKSNLSEDDVHTDRDTLEQSCFSGKKFNVNQTLELDDSSLVLKQQNRIEFNIEELPSSLYPGGLVFKKGDHKIEPIGMITSFGNGISRQYFEGVEKEIDFCTYLHFSKLLEAICKDHGIKFEQQHKSLTSWYMENVHQIRDTIERIVDNVLTQKIVKAKQATSTEDKKDKIRWLSALKDEFLSARFNLFLIEQSLVNLDWWEVSHRNSPPNHSTKDSLIRAYHTTIFRGFIISVFSVIEHCLRDNLRQIDPEACNNARDSFHNILGYLFKRISIEQKELYETLFDLFRNIRNAIHNDGFHYSKNEGDNVSIEYKDKTYDFIDQQPIPINWQDLLIIAEDASNFLVVFLEDELVKEAK
jgi:hypothetical protein